MECIKKITAELSGEMLFEYITAIQGDTSSRYVEITLLNNNRAFVPPSGATAVIRASKPDGTIILNDCEVNTDGTIKAELTGQMLAVCGNVRCQTSIYSSDGGILTSVPFVVKVVSKSAPDELIESKDEFNALKDAKDIANAASEIASEALEKVGEIEESVGAATSAANAATENATSAAASANAAASAANEAAGKITAPLKAANISYDGATSDLGKDNVQDAIDTLASRSDDAAGKLNECSNALKGKITAEGALRIDDISPVKHKMNVRVSSKNLIPYPYSWFGGATEKTLKGVTFIINDDGSITLNGTATGELSTELVKSPISAIEGVYTLSGTPTGTSTTYYLQAYIDNKYGSISASDNKTPQYNVSKGQKITRIVLYIKPGVVFNNLVVKPQFERGNVATDYTPYVDPASVTLSEYRKNLIPYPYANTTKTTNGITFTDNGDGSITINGTATAATAFSFSENLRMNLPGIYTLSKNVPNVYLYIAYYKNNSYVGEKAVSGNNTFTLVDLTSIDCDRVRCAVQITAGAVFNNAVLKPQLELGSTATDYEKSQSPETFTPLADGTVTGVKNIYPTTSLLANKDNVIIDVEYNKDLNKSLNFAPLDESGKIPDGYLHGVTVKQYGVRWKGTSSTVCERLGDAAGLTAKAHKGSTESVDNDFDNIYPWSDIKTCNIDADGNVLAYLGEPSFARDGTNGDVMVEIPKFYYKRVKTGIVEEIWICGTKLPGYELHPLFIDNGKEVSKVFHSVYNASSYTDETDNKVKLQSITGVQPRVRTTRANFRTYARNKGAIWGIEDISCVNALQLLYLVEYANTHSQSALGSGADNLSYTANHKALEETTNGNTITIASTYKNTYKLGQRIEIGTSQGANNKTTTPRTITAITTDEETGQTTITFDGDPITITFGNMMWNVAPLNGSCDALNGKSGWLAGENNYTDHYADVNYRGIEGFHAKLHRFIDGVNIKDRVVYYASSIADYADGVYDGKYRAVGYSNAEANGYVSAFGYDEKAPWVMFPSAAVGGSSTYVPDYYYQNAGERLLLLGGAWSSGTNAGAFFFYCSSAFSYSVLNCGSHLLVKKP